MDVFRSEIANTRGTVMPKGIALAIGLNSVSPQHYGGWSGHLTACEADALDMTGIAKSQKFSAATLLTKSATRAKVIAAIKSTSSKLKSGDIFLLTYSGHGGQLPDLNNDEPDGQDETWCLYDGEIVDDELHALYATFKQGVRILVLSDSCHSGTVVKMAYYGGARDNSSVAARTSNVRYRNLPPDVALRTYRAHQAMYDKILKKKKLEGKKAVVQASVLLISGCQDNQLSADGAFNGLFTGQLLTVWKNGSFKGNYRDFQRAIVRRMPPDQTPKLFLTGAHNAAFEGQKPFTV